MIAKRGPRRLAAILAGAAFVALVIVVTASSALPVPEHPGEPIDGKLAAVARVGDAWWYGTPVGVYARPDSGPGGLLPGITGSILSLTPVGSGWIATGTDGVWRIGESVERIALPAGYTGTLVTSSAATGSIGWLGGPSGLVRLEGSATRSVESPTTSREILDMAASGSDLIAAFPDGVRVLASGTGAWRDLLTGVRCEHLLAGPGGAWVAVTAGGDLLRGSMPSENASSSDAPSGVVQIHLPGARDAVTALGPGNRADHEFIAGTWRCRVFSISWTSLQAREIFGDAIASELPRAPVAALTADGDERIRIATAGVGPLDLLRVDDGTQLEPHALAVAHVASSAIGVVDDAGAQGQGWRERARSWVESVRLGLPLSDTALGSWPWMLALVVGALAVLAAFSRFFLLGRSSGDLRRSGRRKKKEAAAASTPPPLIVELSPDVALHAERFRVLTLRIDDLSREAARGLVESTKQEARKATVELIEVEGWMRERFSALQPILAAERTRLDELGAADRDDVASTRRETLEEHVEQLERDCAYLRYVLEE